MSNLTLVVRKTIRASAERLFDAWTQPEQVRRWWGPGAVMCAQVEIDLKVGGQYRIANQFPDGNIVWITGEFQAIERPRRLVYTWRIGLQATTPERVTVTFEEHGATTEVTVLHEHIADEAARDGHTQGWGGCLDGLADYLSAS